MTSCPYLLHIYSNCYADKTICKEKYIKKQSISGEIFQKKANTRLFAEPVVLVHQHHPQLNGTKIVELEIVYALAK